MGQIAGLFDEITIKQIGQKRQRTFSGSSEKIPRKREKDHCRNLIDVGYGVSQVLPVITELLRPDAPAHVLIATT